MFCARGFFGVGGGSVALQGFSLNADGAPNCAVTVGSDGSVTGSNATAAAWALPVQAGNGASYWLRCSRLSGSVPSGDSSSGSSWVSLATSRGWSINVGPNQVKACALHIDIASDSAGAAIVATGDLTLYADNT